MKIERDVYVNGLHLALTLETRNVETHSAVTDVDPDELSRIVSIACDHIRLRLHELGVRPKEF